MGRKLVMKNFKLYQYFGVGSFIAGWLASSLPDGKITRAEIDQLMNGIFDMLGIEDIKIED